MGFFCHFDERNRIGYEGADWISGVKATAARYLSVSREV